MEDRASIDTHVQTGLTTQEYLIDNIRNTSVGWLGTSVFCFNFSSPSVKKKWEGGGDVESCWILSAVSRHKDEAISSEILQDLQLSGTVYF